MTKAAPVEKSIPVDAVIDAQRGVQDSANRGDDLLRLFVGVLCARSSRFLSIVACFADPNTNFLFGPCLELRPSVSQEGLVIARLEGSLLSKEGVPNDRRKHR
jgi:hypothetical protein